MRTIGRGATLAVALALSGGLAHAVTQHILGKKLQIKDPTGAETSRKTLVLGKEGSATAPCADTIVGDPVANGASLQIIANGGTSQSQTFPLPAGSNWSVVPGGFKWRDLTASQPVHLLYIKKVSGGNVCKFKTLLKGADGGSLNVVPPNPGTDGGAVLSITGGDTYCIHFGGADGGSVSANDNRQYKILSPTGETVCPAQPATTTSTSTSTSTTSSSTTSTCPTPDKQAGCAADEVCNVAKQCQKLTDFCTDPTPPKNTPPGANQCLHQGDAGTCAAGNLNAGTPCCPPGVGGGCDLALVGDNIGTCVRVVRGGWEALNALDPGGFGTLGSFPLRNADNVPMFLSNNHVFARSTGNNTAAANVAALGEAINQPKPGPQAGALRDYECLCLAGSPACPNNCAAPQNQINVIGTNCIDAAIANKSTAGAFLDILDIGTPAAFMAPAASALPCPTAMTTDAMDRIVMKSGARTGLTCGKVTDPASAPVIGNETYKNQFQVEAIPDGAGGYFGAVNGNFSCGGDSGSLVVGIATKKPIGLLFAGNAPGTCVAGATCTAPPASVGNACTSNASCDNPGGAGNGVCQQTKTFTNPIDIVLRRFGLHF